jgi:flagellar hook protein FlgE
MPLAASVVVAGGAASPLGFTFDYSGSTQFGAAFGVNNLTQNGFASGRLVGFDISPNGIIVGRYTNGQSRDLGQVVLADFRNPQGLSQLGNNLFAETASSGLPIVGAPETGSLGVLQSSSVEDSNVDLTTQLVEMITAQRIYQANAQTIKTQDSILQTIVNLP